MEVEKIRAELDRNEKKLLKYENKWNVASIVQRMSRADQSRLLKASVAARTLTVTMIPKLKYKIDTWLTKREDRLVQEIFAEYEIIEGKVRWAFDEFKKLESGYEKVPKAHKNERDKALSLSIEQSLIQRRDSKSVAFKPGNSSSGINRVPANIGENSRRGKSDDDVAANIKLQAASSSNDKSQNDQLIGGGDGGDATENFMTDTANSQLDADEETERFLEQLRGSVSPKELDWLMQSKQKLASPRGMKELERKLDHKDRKILKKQIEEHVKKGIDDQQERLKESKKASAKDGKPFELKAKLPSPVPIDTFLNFVESLPGEVRQMVKEQTDALYSLQEEHVFGKKHLSDRKGRMVSMDKLREEYRDDRFDASDYKIRLPDSIIDEEHLSWIKEQKVDDAVERYFGSFRKREPPLLKGDFLDEIKKPDFMKRSPVSDQAPKEEEDPQELLEKYHLRRVNLLQTQDFEIDG